LIHKLLEHLLRRPESSPEALARVARWFALGEPEAVPLALKAVEQVRASETWRRILSATERLAEVPFAVVVGERGGRELVRGVVDMVYKTADGWEILDWKTEQLTAPVLELAGRHEAQVRAYAKHWSGLTGGGRVRAGVYFVRADEVVWFEGGA
jgi:ATP-dependent exoDNAse (exonuclease V) beta subunit